MASGPSSSSVNPDAWLGFDLGLQAWTLDLDATSAPTVGSPTASSTRIKAPIPQIGLSGGSRGYNGAMEAKAYIHYLGYRSAKYTLYGVDFRVFPVSWFGLRAFYEGGRFDVPKGSIQDDLEVKLEREGARFRSRGPVLKIGTARRKKRWTPAILSCCLA